jgi:anti-anti-sigma regulatory factor
VTAFATEVRHLDGGAIVVRALRDALRPLTRRYDASQVTIACEALEFIDLRGLDELLRASNALRSGRIRLRNPSRMLRVLLDLTSTTAFDVDVDPRVSATRRP